MRCLRARPVAAVADRSRRVSARFPASDDRGETAVSDRGYSVAGRLRFALLALLIAAPALAVQPGEMLKNPALEARARALSSELRCLVCQNESIDDSDADLARDIRLLIRERITKGESNTQVRDFLVSRYGDFLLLKPPFKLSTALLWLSAPLTLLLGALAIFSASRRKPAPVAPLTAQEEERLAQM